MKINVLIPCAGEGKRCNLYEKGVEKIYLSTPLNCYLVEKEQLSHYGKAAQEFVFS